MAAWLDMKTASRSTDHLVFLPGAGGSADFWRPVGERLPFSGAKIYLSWPGLGDEPRDPAFMGFEDAIGRTLDAIGEGNAGICAQSMGGLIALAATLRRPGDVRALVLVATSGGVDAAREASRLHDWRSEYRDLFPNADPWITEERTDLTSRLGEITCPVLLVFGGADPIAPPFVGERLAELLPNCELRVLDGAGHDLVLERHDDLLPMIARHFGGT